MKANKMGHVLAITGMHRSGTSMVAHYLQLCGINIGEHLHPADRGNPKGYFEDEELLNLHKDILVTFGLPAFPTEDEQLSQKIPEKFKLFAQQIIHERKKLTRWGWKDCRTSLFLDFWKDLIPEINVLFLYRHPVGVVDSLLRRNTDKIIQRDSSIAFKSWQLHNQRIMRFYFQNQPHCFIVDIDDLIQNPNAAFPQIFSKLNLDLPIKNWNSIYTNGTFRKRKSLNYIKLFYKHPHQTILCLKHYYMMKNNSDFP